MAQSRKYFVEQITKQGFKRYYPKGNIFKYLERVFFKCEPFAFGLSPKGSSVDVAVYNLNTKSNRHFGSYTDAWMFFNSCKKELIENFDSVSKPSIKIKRKK